MAKASISIGDHVHYAPENLEAENAGLTPTWIVTYTNAHFSGLVQVGAPGLFNQLVAPTADLVPADPNDLTEINTDSE